MRASILVILIAALLRPPAFSEPGVIDLPQHGFQISALDVKPGESPGTALMMFLPASDGFAPNVNVQIQPYTGTIKEYAELSKSQFGPMKWMIISEMQTGDARWVAEYKGPMQGKDLHFYANAVAKGGKVYLVTATATESQWAAAGALLRKHVDSFQTK